jgi:hypothetical protein
LIIDQAIRSIIRTVGVKPLRIIFKKCVAFIVVRKLLVLRQYERAGTSGDNQAAVLVYH